MDNETGDNCEITSQVERGTVQLLKDNEAEALEEASKGLPS